MTGYVAGVPVLEVHKTPTTRLQRILRLVVALAAVVLTSNASADHSVKEKTKEETELHLGVSESAFKKLESAFELYSPTTLRTDFYFDIPQNNQFYMRRNVTPAKLRVQKRADQVVLQKSWIQHQSTHISQGFRWMKTTRVSSSVKKPVNGNTGLRLEYSQSLLENSIKNSQISQGSKTYLEELWHPEVWPRLSEFDSSMVKSIGSFVPAAIVSKERWLLNIKTLNGEDLTVQLGRDSDVLGSGRPQSYEIEAELKDSSPKTSVQVAEAISHWLQSYGIEPAETSPHSSHDFFRRLEQLYP